MAKQNLENGATFGVQRQKINDNFTEVYDNIANIELIPGPQGEPGEQGPQGIQGTKGDKGDPGTLDLPIDINTGTQGVLEEDRLPAFTADDIFALFDNRDFKIEGGKIRKIDSGSPTLAQTTVTFGTSTTTQNVVNWNAVTNATSYVVQRSLNSNMSSPTTIYTGALLTYTDTGLTSSTTYYYTVTASATNYISSVSDIASKATAAASGGDTIVFAENFGNTTAAKAPLSSVNWKLYNGDGFSNDETPQTSTLIEPTQGSPLTTNIPASGQVTNLGYFSILSNKLSSLFYTEKFSLDTNTTTPKKVVFTTANSVTGTTTTIPRTYVAVKVGTTFYIYDQPTLQTNPNSGNFATSQEFEITLDMLTSGKWRSLTFVSGSGLYVNAPIAGTLPKGVTYFGAFFTTSDIGASNNGNGGAAVYNNRTLRIDGYKIIV